MTQHRTLHRVVVGVALAVAAAIAASVPAMAEPMPLVQPVCPAEPETGFTDLDPNSVHTGNVVCAGAIGLLQGGPGGQPADVFGPLLTTTRGQLATIMANVIETYRMELDHVPADRFTDDDGTTHETNTNWLSELDIIGPDVSSGFDFQPSFPATRGLIADFMYGTWMIVVGENLEDGPNAFVDDDGHPFEDEIDALAAAGVIAGKSPGIFDPNASVTREQIATMLVNLLEKMADRIASFNQ